MSNTWLPLNKGSRPSENSLVVVIADDEPLLCTTYQCNDPEDEGLYIECENEGKSWNLDKDEDLPLLFFQLPDRTESK